MHGLCPLEHSLGHIQGHHRHLPCKLPLPGSPVPAHAGSWVAAVAVPTLHTQQGPRAVLSKQRGTGHGGSRGQAPSPAAGWRAALRRRQPGLRLPAAGPRPEQEAGCCEWTQLSPGGSASDLRFRSKTRPGHIKKRSPGPAAVPLSLLCPASARGRVGPWEASERARSEATPSFSPPAPMTLPSNALKLLSPFW